MLEQAKRMGTNLMVATPHFYGDSETPTSFLKRRACAAEQLLRAGYRKDKHPRLLLGAEVAYFPGIGRCDDLSHLCIVGTRMILIEMPFRPWSQTMLEDLYAVQTNLELIPVLAHIERYPDMHSASMIMSSNSICGYSGAISRAMRRNMPSVHFMMFALCTAVTLRRPFFTA